LLNEKEIREIKGDLPTIKDNPKNFGSKVDINFSKIEPLINEFLIKNYETIMAGEYLKNVEKKWLCKGCLEKYVKEFEKADIDVWDEYKVRDFIIEKIKKDYPAFVEVFTLNNINQFEIDEIENIEKELKEGMLYPVNERIRKIENETSASFIVEFGGEYRNYAGVDYIYLNKKDLENLAMQVGEETPKNLLSLIII
jgi:hypothetical protein